MWEVEFYTITFDLLKCTTIEEAERVIMAYLEMISELRRNKLSIKTPSDLYNTKICSELELFEYLFYDDQGQNEDIRSLIREIIEKDIKTGDISFDDLIYLLNSDYYKAYKALISHKQVEIDIDENLKVLDPKGYLAPYRFYLSHSETLEEFQEAMKDCFPHLLFHNRVYQTMNAKLRDIGSFQEELIRHLSAINDYAKEVYEEVGNREFYRVFKSRYNIECSGRGSRECGDGFKCKFSNRSGIEEEVTCNPHTKLYNSYSEYRIYFSFGKESIADGKILIGHIGGHWE
ncbi:hypothetical protein CS063_14900 [Sporanaerobium hydrogeniformans]|uniref:Uncharacterized protein n=1 Tax=Sporanaerobium hydrogeniformans TaxID=3072179 RepID=A0AC61DA49_9FIRM|nr:hypothetical protein [Sporanaerobium hydrogeniformans]PHV69596.1 hypothetical protein CS063_14900 [Sporanaerobium hydrogeniformans]